MGQVRRFSMHMILMGPQYLELSVFQSVILPLDYSYNHFTKHTCTVFLYTYCVYETACVSIHVFDGVSMP